MHTRWRVLRQCTSQCRSIYINNSPEQYYAHSMESAEAVHLTVQEYLYK